jgi:hypothetical protein
MCVSGPFLFAVDEGSGTNVRLEFSGAARRRTAAEQVRRIPGRLLFVSKTFRGGGMAHAPFGRICGWGGAMETALAARGIKRQRKESTAWRRRPNGRR